MGVYLFIFFIISLTAIAAVLFQCRFELVLPCCICYIILMIYVSGLIADFLPGFLIVLLTVPLGGLFCLIRRRKTLWKDIYAYAFTPGFLFFTVTICVMLPWTMKMRINSWDEFSHWSTVIKNFWYLNDFANLENSTTSFKGYPPAASIFAWFAQRFGRNYDECKSYLAYHVLYLAWMCPYFCIITEKKQWWKALLMGLCIIQLPTIGWYRAYDVTLVDSLLGVQTALLLVAYALYKNVRWRNITICLMTIVICLTKASGVGLCMIVLLIILTGEVMRVRREGKLVRNAFYLPGNMGISVILGKYSWDIYLKISKTEAAWDTSGVTIKGIWELFSGNAPAYRYQAMRNFGKSFATVPMVDGGILPLSCLAWFLLLLVGGIWYYHFGGGERSKTEKKVCILGTLFGLPIYAGTLLLLYLFTYSENEALDSASFGRYMGTWLVCCCAVVLVLLFDYFKSYRQWGIGIVVLAVVLCGYLPTYSAIITATPITLEVYKNNPIDYRFQNVKQTLDGYGRDNLKIFFVHQQDSGYWYWVCRYGITPYQVQSSWREIDEEDSSEQWAEELVDGGYSHVFLNDSEGIVENFGDLFDNIEEINCPALYEVICYEDGIKLHKVEEYW